MNKRAMRSLEVKLSKFAEEFVGEVGQSTNTLKAVTGSPYVKYSVMFRDVEKMRRHFEKWIESYKAFVGGACAEGECSPLWSGETKILFWRSKPEILEGENERKGWFKLNARLLISLRPSAWREGVIESMSREYARKSVHV